MGSCLTPCAVGGWCTTRSLALTAQPSSDVTPDPHPLWRHPRWALAILLAVMGMLAPFSIDTYLPAFAGIAQALHASPVQMQPALPPT